MSQYHHSALVPNVTGTDEVPLLQWNAGSHVYSIAISHDGTRVASGSADSHVRIWDVNTGALVLGPLKAHIGGVWCVAWSRDDTLILSGSSDGTIGICNTRTGTTTGRPFKGSAGAVYSVAFSPDDTRMVSGSWDKTIRIWDVRTGGCIAEPLIGHTDKVRSVLFSSDGTFIVSGSEDKTIRIWDASTGAPIGEPLRGHGSLVISVALSPNNARIVSGSGDETIRIWDVRTGAPIGEPLGGHTSWVNSVAFSSDSTCIVSGSRDNTIRMWDAHTGVSIGEPLAEHTSIIHSVTFTPDGNHIVSGSGDETICVWKVTRDTSAFSMVADDMDTSSVDVGVDQTEQDVPSFEMVTSKMSIQELFECLVRHGCSDLTSSAETSRSSAVITSGGFGDVRRLEMDGGKVVAIKTLRLHVLRRDDDKAVKRTVREVYMWSRLNHVNVQPLLGIIMFQGGLGMVSPWMEQGNLQQYLTMHPYVERYALCVQVASGVSYLHSVGMVHGDLKANNILVSDDVTLKISDFDYAILADSSLQFSATTRPGGGTLRWMAPELLQPEEEDEQPAKAPTMRCKESDIYALGMTMLEILTGNVPYAEYRSDMGIYRAIHNKQPPKRPTELSGTGQRSNMMWSLLLECWDHDPVVRPDASSVTELLEFKRPAAGKRIRPQDRARREPDVAGASTSTFSRLKQLYQNITR